MNLFKQALKKIGLVLSVLLLWLLDDFVPFLPDVAVWSMVGVVLKWSGHSERLDGLKIYWTGGE